MPKSNGFVSIGLNIDYQKSLEKMMNDFKSKLTQISNESKKIGFSKDMAEQIGGVNKRIDEVSENVNKVFKEINETKIDATNFEKYQTEITKKFDKINSSISEVTDRIVGLEEKLGMLSGSDFATNMKKQFDDLSRGVLETYNGLKQIIDITKTSAKGGLDKGMAESIERYNRTLRDIKKIRQEIKDAESSALTDDPIAIEDDGYKLVDILEKQINAYKSLKTEISGLSKSSPDYAKKEARLARLQAVIERNVTAVKRLDEAYEATTGNVLLDDVQGKMLMETNGFSQEVDSFILKAEKMQQEAKGVKDSVEQIQGSFNTFQIKNGAIHIPIDVATKNSELKNKIQEIVKELQEYADGNTIIAKVKLTLDGGSSKGYKKDAEIDKQQIEGQNEPALDIAKTIQKTYRNAAREAESIVKSEIKKIQEEFETVPIKLKPDTKAFEKEVSAMVKNSLRKIANETSGININKELEKLVENLKELSTSLSGNENFKLGIDEESINRITMAIENMANMIQRAFKVASDGDIAAQWSVIESKFKSAAGEEGKLLKGNKEQKIAIKELATEYKKYLDMGGKNDLSALTSNKQTIKNITAEYENLGKAVQEVTEKQEKQSKEKPHTKVSTETSEAIKATTRANKSLETQADKTSAAVENEGKTAETASTKFGKLAKEKGAAVVANRELAKAAKETADALEREAAAKKSGAGKTNKNAVDDATYANNFLKWQDEIKQSLIESGNYADVYDTKISQTANGTVKFTAVVRDLDGELKKFSATVKDTGGISSPSITDMSEKQAANFEKNLILAERLREALAGMDGEGNTPTSYNREDLERYIATILEAEEGLEKFRIKKVEIDDIGRLAITTELKDGSEEVKTFVARFKNVEDIIDESTGAVKNFGEVLENAFDSGKFTTSITDFAAKAEDALKGFVLKNEGDSNFSAIVSDLERLESTIKDISSQDDLNKFKHELLSLGTVLKNIKADEKLGTLFEGQTQTYNDINGIRDNLDSLLGTMGKVNEKSIRIKDMKTLTAEVEEADGTIRKMTVNLDSAGFARFVDNGISEFTRLERNSRKILSGIGSLVRIYLSPQDFVRYFRQGLDKIREIDVAMTELRKVSDATSAEISSYFGDAVESAKELGSSVRDMISATADWSRMGIENAPLYSNI